MKNYEVINKIKGVMAYPPTPFKKDGTVDFKGLKKHLNFLEENKVHIIAPAGGTGEFFSLTLEEWKEVISTTVETINESLILPAVGKSVEEAKEMARFAENLGCKVIQIMPPHSMFGNRIDGIFEYNKEIAGSVSIGVIPYNLEGSMSIGLVDRLMTIENVVAIKDESGDIQWFRKVIERYPDLIGICATAEMFAPYYFLAGASAFSSGIVNFLPQVSLSVYHAIIEKRYDDVFVLQKNLRGLIELRSKSGRHIPVVKEALNLMGFSESIVRPPLCLLTDSEREILKNIMKEFNII